MSKYWFLRCFSNYFYGSGIYLFTIHDISNIYFFVYSLPSEYVNIPNHTL